MSESIVYQVDLDREAILFESEWLGRQDLAERIKKAIENQDFRISAASSALEYLENTLANVKTLGVRLVDGDAKRLEKFAARDGISTGSFIRQSVLAYMAALPPLGDDAPAQENPTDPASLQVPDMSDAPASDEALVVSPPDNKPKPVLTTITTEPATPGEAADAVELTDRKTHESSSVVVDPAVAGAQDSGSAVGGGWFKKE